MFCFREDVFDILDISEKKHIDILKSNRIITPVNDGYVVEVSHGSMRFALPRRLKQPVETWAEEDRMWLNT